MVGPPEVLDALLHLTRQLCEERPLEESLQLVTDAWLRLLPGDHASVRLVDDTRTLLLCGARSGEGEAERRLTFRPGLGIAGWVVENGRLARVDDTDEDPRFVKAPQQGFEIRSILALPLSSGGEVVGVLAATAPSPAAFSAEDEVLAQLLANCTVPPIDRARLERLAVVDPRTMAFNERYLQPRLAEEIARAARYVTPLGILMMDLDHLERVNDAHGRAAGDLVLREFARRVRESTRRYDVLFRRGGEEFALIMPNATEEESRVVAERIHSSMAGGPFEVSDGVTLTQTVSIGVAAWDGRESAEALEGRADFAMYEAKRTDRDGVYVSRGH